MVFGAEFLGFNWTVHACLRHWYHQRNPAKAGFVISASLVFLARSFFIVGGLFVCYRMCGSTSVVYPLDTSSPSLVVTIKNVSGCRRPNCHPNGTPTSLENHYSKNGKSRHYLTHHLLKVLKQINCFVTENVTVTLSPRFLVPGMNNWD